MIDCIQSLLWPKLTVSEKLQHQLSVDENLHWQILGNGSREKDENYALWRKDSQSTQSREYLQIERFSQEEKEVVLRVQSGQAFFWRRSQGARWPGPSW